MHGVTSGCRAGEWRQKRQGCPGGGRLAVPGRHDSRLQAERVRLEGPLLGPHPLHGMGRGDGFEGVSWPVATNSEARIRILRMTGNAHEDAVVATGGWQGATVVVGMMLAGVASAQQAAPQAVPPALSPPPVDGTALPSPPPATAGGNVTTLGEVRAIKPEDDQPLDLYRFKNPVQAEPNRFSKNWSEPPTVEEVSLSGGYVMMGIYYGLAKAAQGFNKLTHAPAQIQSAIARPPPELTPEQQRRAATFCAQQDCVQPAEGR